MAEYPACLERILISARLINGSVGLSVVDDLKATLSKLESRMAMLEKSQSPASKTVTFTKVDVRYCLKSNHLQIILKQIQS